VKIVPKETRPQASGLLKRGFVWTLEERRHFLAVVLDAARPSDVSRTSVSGILLKLKAPVEVLVIDDAEKAPTEN